MKTILQYSLVLASLFIISCSRTKFVVDLESGGQYCFSDSLDELVLYKMKYFFDKDEYLRITLTRNNQIFQYDAHDAGNQYLAVTFEETDLEFCFENKNNNSTMTVYIDYRTGVDAKYVDEDASKEEGSNNLRRSKSYEDALNNFQ